MSTTTSPESVESFVEQEPVSRQSGDRRPLQPRSSEQWVEYFSHNKENLLPIPWETGAELTETERSAIAASVQGFQLGESSEGRHLAKCARDYAHQQNDLAYDTAIRLFIGEEQRHARDLGRFLKLNGIDLIRKTWPDTVFRMLRHRAGLGLSISVLVTAEIIAEAYYPALRDATSSRVLRALCDQIIQDETPHVEFQCERLAILRRDRGRLGLMVTHALHRVLFAGTIPVVWLKHGRAIRAGGRTFRQFSRECWTYFRKARQIMDPRT